MGNSLRPFLWERQLRIQTKDCKPELVQNDELLSELMGLQEVELQRVQWCLSQVLLQGFPPIPPDWLCSADACSTAKTMLKCYDSEGALATLDAALALIGRHDLVRHRPLEPPCLKPAPKPNPDFLKTQRRKLICRTQKLDAVMDILQECEILNTANKEAINIYAVQLEKNRALVDLLLKKGRQAQNVFFKALSKTDPFFVQELLKRPIRNKDFGPVRAPDCLEISKFLEEPEHSESSVLIYMLDFLVADELRSFHWLMRDHMTGESLHSTDDNPSEQKLLGNPFESHALNVVQKIVPAFSVCLQGKAVTSPGSSDTSVETDADSSVVEITPEVAVECDMFRLRCQEPGIYRCRLTGLLLEGFGDLVYQSVPWDVGFLSSKGLRPAGPLFRFTLLTGNFHRLHLPHCQRRSGGGLNFLSIVHITEESVDFITPGQLTDSHVIVNVSGFSCFGLVISEESHAVINGLVLLFFHESFHSLYILLLPRNICLTLVTNEWKRRIGAQYVQTVPNCELIPNQMYKLTGQPVNFIQPEMSKFLNFNDYTNFLPSFQVQMEADARTVELELRSHVTGLPLISWLFGSTESVVWNRVVQLRATASAVCAEVCVPDSFDVTLRLVDALNSLGSEDLKTFQHLLSLQPNPIPVSRLEGADRTRTVDVMVQQYHSEGAKEVTDEILRRMNYNQLADHLLKN